VKHVTESTVTPDKGFADQPAEKRLLSFEAAGTPDVRTNPSEHPAASEKTIISVSAFFNLTSRSRFL
jgi:hypothetical protein